MTHTLSQWCYRCAHRYAAATLMVSLGLAACATSASAQGAAPPVQTTSQVTVKPLPPVTTAPPALQATPMAPAPTAPGVVLPASATFPIAQDAVDADDVRELAKRLAEVEAELKKTRAGDEKKKKETAAKPTVTPRGRIHTDAGWFHQSDANQAVVGDIQDGTYFRRARLGFDAKAFEVTEYRLDFEMGGNGRPSIFDAYGKVTQLPYLGFVQLGHFREPFSLEAQTSSNWYTFIERGLPNVFDPSRNWGIMAFNNYLDESVTLGVGVFRDGSDDFGDDVGDSGERAVTARATWLPYYDEPSEGRYYTVLGVSGSYREPDNKTVRYQQRPEFNLREQNVGGVPNFVDTGNILTNDVQLGGVEAAWVHGPLCLQSELICSNVNAQTGGDQFFHGAYVYASYFLTGEHRTFKRSVGQYDRIKVFENFFRVRTGEGICTGTGAWEVAARYSYLDLNDGPTEGGRMDDFTFGVNWYLSSYMRMMFNYVHSQLDDPTADDTDANIYATRLDVSF